MGRRVVLDTGVLVAAERGRFDLGEVVGEDDAAIAAVSVAELRFGALVARVDGPAARRGGFVDALLAEVPVEPYTTEVAERHAELMAHVRATGTPRGAHDLIIAATAVATGRALITTDARARFAELPGVEAHLIGG